MEVIYKTQNKAIIGPDQTEVHYEKINGIDFISLPNDATKISDVAKRVALYPHAENFNAKNALKTNIKLLEALKAGNLFKRAFKYEVQRQLTLASILLTKIYFFEALNYKKRTGNQYKNPALFVNEQSIERRKRHCFKGIKTEEKLNKIIDMIEKTTGSGVVSPFIIERQKKEFDKQDRIEKAKQRKASKKDQEKLKDIKLYNLPINKLHTKIEPNSVDLILTDPPYEKQALPLFKELSHFAGKVLKPGGSLLCMSGNMYLPEVIDNLRDCKKIHYHFLCSYVMDGPTSQEHSRKVFVSSKPIIWFTKGAYNGEAINNTIKPDKSCESSNQYHKWGQSVDGFLKILEKNFVFPGDVICDPFLGAGATAIASYKHGCKFIGSDIDPECIKTTNGRLVEVVQNTKD